MIPFKKSGLALALFVVAFAPNPAVAPSPSSSLLREERGTFPIEEKMPALWDVSSPEGESPAFLAPAGAADLSIKDFSILQAEPNEPLVLGKETVARVWINVPGGSDTAAKITIMLNDKLYERAVTLLSPESEVTFSVDPPTQLVPVTAKVTVTAMGGAGDPNLANDSKTATVPTVRTTERIVAFFLPVDWTPEQQQKDDFVSFYPQFVQDAGDYLVGAYPLSKEQLVYATTTTPHILTTIEKAITDSQGKDSSRNLLALYGSITIAGRRYRPDATMIIAVLPPGWFRAHGMKALGMALREVKGTITSEFDENDPTTAAHETGHLYWLDEDYDCAVDSSKSCSQPPNVGGIEVQVPGYWVQRDRELLSSPDHLVWTYMSSGNPKAFFWTDPGIYEYLMAKFSMAEGAASGPLILAATPSYKVEQDGYPSQFAANKHRLEPKKPVYLSVAGMTLRAGSEISVKLYRGNSLVKSDKKTTVAGNKWYAFLLGQKNALAEGSYRAQVYLDGQLQKSTSFEVRAGK